MVSSVVSYGWSCLPNMHHSLILKVTVKLDPQNDQLKNNQLKKRTNNLVISNGYAYVLTLSKLSITCTNAITINSKWSRYCELSDPNSENAFPKDFLTKHDKYQDNSKSIRISKRKTEQLYSVWNIGAKHHFSCRVILTKQCTILILRFLCFGARKRITGDCFVIRINKMTYSKPNMECFIYFIIFCNTFPTSCIPHSFV